MSAFTPVRPGKVYRGGMAPVAVDHRRFDIVQYKSLNLDLGGTWNPTKSPIIIGGVGGLRLPGGSAYSRGAQTLRGGRLVQTASSYPTFNPGRTRAETLHLYDAIVPTGNTNQLEESFVTLSEDPLGIIVGGSTALQLSVPSRYLHTGANLATVTLSYRLLSRPTALPSAGTAMISLSGFTPSFGAAWASSPNINPLIFNLTQWVTGTSYALGRYVVPTNANANGKWYKATAVSGTHTSGGAEPTWPTTIGATVVDNAGANQITWTCTGRSGQIAPASVDAYYAGGAPQTVSWDFDPNVANFVDTGVYKYVLSPLGTVDPNVVLTSVKFSFTNIGTNYFE